MKKLDRHHKHILMGAAVVVLVGGYVWYISKMGPQTGQAYPESAYKQTTQGPGPPGGVVVRGEDPISRASTSMTKREMWNGASTQSYPLSRGY